MGHEIIYQLCVFHLIGMKGLISHLTANNSLWFVMLVEISAYTLLPSSQWEQ